QRLESRIRILIDQLLDPIVNNGEMDLIADLAYPLPASVILDMLGLPCDDLDRIKVWSDELALFVGSSVNTPDKYKRATDSITSMNEYFHAAIHRRRRTPGDDLLTALLAAQEQGDLLSDDELVATCVLLVFAGHETTTNLIGNGILSLLRHPTELSRLRDEPGLMPLAVEELLRFDGPAASVVRIATEDISLHGQKILAGDRVFAMLNAANRDPRQFANPETLDIARKENRHLAFGHGIHFCIGAPLARMEAKLAISAILQRCPNLDLQSRPLHWNNSLVLRGVRSLPVSFDKKVIA
ncbi:cytochrome P450, partial [bacterium]|nr:cytochrome P450 [bacterium]